MKRRVIPYSAAEMEWLEQNRLMVISDYHASFVARFGRQDVTQINLHSLRKRKGWRTGRTGQFVKGQEAFNKGQRCPEGKGGRHPNAMATQFKAGQEPHNTKHVGHERTTKYGYIEISVESPNPYTGYSRRYVMKHRWLWEQANGPIPAGYALKCLDGDRLNTDPSNWECLPRGVLARLNAGRFRSTLPYDEASAELKPVVMATAQLKHALYERRKEVRGQK